MPDHLSPFNSPLEAGLRSLFVLGECYPSGLDLSALVSFDYLVVHSGDLGGPVSLHAPVPLRSGEILIRRTVVEKGLLLMLSRGLLERQASPNGFVYVASDTLSPFVESLHEPYSLQLKSRAKWAVDTFFNMPAEQLRLGLNRLFEGLATQFQSVEKPTLT